MALINCPNCNKKVSDSAKACPHCGFAVKKNLKEDKAKIDFSNLNSLVDMAKANWKPLVVVGVAIICVIVAGSFLGTNKSTNNDKDYGDTNYSDEKNKSGYPDVDRVYLDAKKQIEKDLSEFSFNGKPLDIKYDKDNIKDLAVVSDYGADLAFQFIYQIDDIVSLGIPYEIRYDIDGKKYKFVEVNNQVFMQGYRNIELASCDKIRTEDDKSILEFIKSEYKDEYDEITLKDTKKNSSSCTTTFEAKKNGVYITKDDTITVTSSLSTTDEKNYKIKTSTKVDENRKFNLVGKWHGEFVRRGTLPYPSTIDFEITEVNGIGLMYGETGWITEDDKPNKYYWKLVDTSGYLEKSRYGYYTFKIGYKYGKDASGAENIKTVRVYDDKLLFFCSSDTRDTDGCYELKRS